MTEIVMIQDPVTEYARERGWLARRMKYLGRNGCPDSWFFRKGRIIIIEFKAPKKRPNLQQSREHDRLRKVGFEVFVIDDYEKGCRLFD